MRVNTDKYIVCSDCGEAKHYGRLARASYVRKQAHQDGWKGSDRKTDPVCPDCIEKRKGERDGKHS